MTNSEADRTTVNPAPDLRLGLTINPQAAPRTWVRRTAYALEERGGQPFLAATDTRPMEVRLPLELLPTVAELDLESPDAVLGFVNEYGPLKAWPEGFGQMGIGDTSAFSPTPAVQRLVRWRKAMKDDDDRKWGEFVDEFRVAAGGLQALVLVRRELESEQFSYAHLEKGWPPSCPWPNQWLSMKKRAWPMILALINTGLVSTRLVVSVPGLDRGIDTDGDRVLDSLGQTADEALSLQMSGPFSLYGACLLELTQHILEGREYRNCASEPCGRLFSMQEGRSRSGRHRTDVVKFCSRACALAQAQREHRRRRAER